ncbi:CpaF family protein [Hydrogenophaga taeniospiralis]|uniref:CpaF family protein n=1 Tax=Hydrogenophaga taeniospiralis TaxID=65656 RepID=UPI001CFA6B4D|nr:CpaF family protein [Hydrogenophaga taeniospiralis]MCB4364374.1 CpaF family protein [Hydrogenophaga taeniospiralis]
MNMRVTTPELRSPTRLNGSEEDRSLPGGAIPLHNALKDRLHTQLLGRIDLEVMGSMKPERLREELGVLTERLLVESGAALNAQERKRMIQDIQDEIMGLGPLEPLLADPTVSDILVNGPNQVFVERRGRLELTEVTFSDSDHLMKIIDKIVSRIGRRVDESSPMVDARLPDGSRVNAIIPPLALDGPVLSIRRFAVVPLTVNDLIDRRSLPPVVAALLQAMVKAKMNILISGGTGTGKTTLLNVLSAAIPASERIVTIEDAAELQLQQRHVVRLETRPPNIEGKGEVSQRALVRNSLRMRPDRVILGEVRGAEVLDMLQAMNTGHEGSMATVHANSPRDALTRLENMAGYGGAVISEDAMRQQVSSAINAVIQLSRLNDGRRKLISLMEITGMEGSVITMQEIFHFRQTGIDAEGKVVGHFRATGVRPKFMERLKAFGQTVTDDTFDPNLIYE